MTLFDLDLLRAAGFDRAQVLRLNLFIALRIAFSARPSIESDVP